MKPRLGGTLSRAVLLAALLAVSGPVAAWAQAKPSAARSQQFQDWRRECVPPAPGKPVMCTIRQAIFNKDKKPVLAVAMGYFGAKHEPGAIFDLPFGEVPHGFFLLAGVVFAVAGTEPVKIVIQRCEPQGCTAALLLPSDMLSALKKGATATVTVESGDRKKLSAEISLKGFSKAFASLKK